MSSFFMRTVKDITSTQAYQDWQASNPGSTEMSQDVIDAINLELQQKKEAGNGNGGSGEGGAGGAGGNGDTKPNKTLLIGGAIAAVALLILILKK